MPFFKKIINQLIKRIQKTDKVIWLVAGFVAIYIIYFTLVSFTKQDYFLTGRYDLGNMDQTVWNTLHGRIFTFTNPDLNQNLLRLSAHADFILIFLAPFYLLWEDPKMLLLIQTIVLGFGAFFVYLIGKDILKQKLIPFILALSYLLNPFVERQNTFDFHSVVLSTTFLLACFYFLQKNKYFAFTVFLTLALLTKEHVYLVAGLLGIYIYIVKKKKWGILLSIFSFTFFYLLIAKFIPDARGANHFALAYYGDFGDSPVEIIKTFFTNPMLIVNTLIKNNVLEYYRNLFLPVGFLSLLSPLYLVFALPEIVINSLSSNPNWRIYYYQYAAISLSFIYISTIFGIKTILNRFPKKSLFVALYLLISITLSTYLLGPFFFSKDVDRSMSWVPKNKILIDKYIKTIPENAFVASTNNLGAHLSHREKNYSLGKNYLDAEYVLFLIRPNSLENLNKKDWDVLKARNMLKNKNFNVIYKLDNFIVFKKIRS